MYNRTVAEISLKNLEHNYQILKEGLPPGCTLMGIVKSDAYGHGAVEVSRRLCRLGCTYLAVANLDEAMILREQGIGAPILILGYTDPANAPLLIEHEMTQTVFSEEYAAQLSKFAGAGTVKAHIKLDTGMGRLGFSVYQASEAELLPLLRTLAIPNIYYEGAFTHLAVSDCADGEAMTLGQIERFETATGRLETAKGSRFKYRHCANSAGVLAYPQAAMDMVRPGIALYGYGCVPGSGEDRLKPVMSVKSEIVQLKEIPAGATVSYATAFRAQRKTKVAVVPIGYNDGLMRTLSGKIYFQAGGTKAPQIGRICMDMCMLDVTDIPEVTTGSRVTIFGEGEQTAQTLADILGTIPYEIVCAVDKRVPRIYV